MNISLKDLGLSLIPFTPVSFTGNDKLLAYVRLFLYGGSAYYMLTKNQKNIALILGGATLVSAISSITANFWENRNNNSEQEKIAQVSKTLEGVQ